MKIFGKSKREYLAWIIALLLIVAIRVWASDHYSIETFYTRGFYSNFAAAIRLLFGHIPFSIGDIMYLAAGCWLLWKIIQNSRFFLRNRFNRDLFLKKLSKLAWITVSIYIIFNIFWGLNYNRKGVAWQLQLKGVAYDTAEVLALQQLLVQKVNAAKRMLVSGKALYPDKKDLLRRANECYAAAEKRYPFLAYHRSSVKSSFYGRLGNYLGFTGYYNPFTGEAQVNSTVPKFLLPFVTLHEIGHQLGYAKEDEANFSGYLAAANSTDTLFQYSTYLDLFVYANHEVFYFDSVASKSAVKQLIPEVKADLLEWKRFDEQYTSIFEPAISWIYGKYLQANQQPKGLRSYNEVIAMLMAYYAKYGTL
jgi:hypothetical protein